MNFFKIFNLLALPMLTNTFNACADVKNAINTEPTSNITIDLENINFSEEIDVNNSFAEGLEDITDALNTSHNSELNRSFIEHSNSGNQYGNVNHELQIDFKFGHTYRQTMAEHSTLQCKKILPN